MKNKISMLAVLLIGSFTHAKIERTLVDGSVLTFLEGHDTIKQGGYTFKIGDYFFPLQNELSFNAFLAKALAAENANPAKAKAFIEWSSTFFLIPGSLKGRALFTQAFGKPYFSLMPQFAKQFGWENHISTDCLDYFKIMAKKEISGDLPFVLVIREERYYQIYEISTLKEAVKIFNELLTQDPKVFLLQ